MDEVRKSGVDAVKILRFSNHTHCTYTYLFKSKIGTVPHGVLGFWGFGVTDRAWPGLGSVSRFGTRLG